LLYDTGHIPGAVHIDWRADLQDPVIRDYISPEKFARLCSRHGIPPAQLQCEFAAVGLQPVKQKVLTGGEAYFTAFRIAGTRPAPDRIKACPA